jgi:hypothetical protein
MILPFPLTDNDAFAVSCMMISGVGTETGFTPHAAVAVMVTLRLDVTSRVNDIGTVSLPVTFIYGY